MAFLINNAIISNQGAAAVRSANEDSKKIVFTRGLLGSNFDKDRQDWGYKPIDWYDPNVSVEPSGWSVSEGCTECTVAFDTETEGVPVKSIAVCIQPEKEGESPEYDPADDIIYAVWSDENCGFLGSDTFSVKFQLPVILNLADSPDANSEPGGES